MYSGKKKEETLEQLIYKLGILIKTTKDVMAEILQPLMPMTEEKIIRLSTRDRTSVDSLAMRYLKIQDMLSCKIFMRFLDVMQENPHPLTFIDILNHLEKLEILSSAYRWRDLRDLRNHLVHEYPNEPELVADFLNKAYEALPELIAVFEAIEQRLASIKK